MRTSLMSRSVGASIAAIAIGCGSLGACGDDQVSRIDEEPPTPEHDLGSTGPRTAATPSSTRFGDETPSDVAEVDPIAGAGLQFEFVRCDQVAFEMATDRAAARTLVPDDYELYPPGGSLATLWHWAKDCDDIVVDGAPVGAGKFDALMVQLVGPPEMRKSGSRPDLGASDVDYQYPILWITDNAEFRRAMTAFGTPMVLADVMTFDVSPGTIHTGSAVADAYDPPIDYSWTTVDDLRWTPGLDAFIAHTILNRDDTAVHVYDVDAILNPTWFGRSVMFDLGETALAASFGSELAGTGYGMTVTAVIDANRASVTDGASTERSTES